MKLETADDWWTQWGNISENVKGYIVPIRVSKILDNAMAHAVIGHAGIEALKENQNGNPIIYEVWDRLTRARDKRLYFLLHSVWDDAPDSRVIHSWPSWHDFCDLLSEGPDCLRLYDD